MLTTQEATISLDTLDALGLAAFVVELDGRVGWWSRRMEALGVSRKDAEGRPAGEAFEGLLRREGERAALDRWIAGVAGANGEGPMEAPTLLLHVDSPTFPGQVFRATAAAAGGGRVTVVMRETTPEEQLRAQFERILDSTPDGIFVIDPQKRLRLFNQACGEITGRRPSEILTGNCTCSDVIECHTEEGESYATNLCPAKGVFRGENTHQREEMLLTNSAGEERWVETMYSPVKDEAGEVECVIGILRDVHERKLLEEKLYQSEKLATLGQLVAGIAHEIKNPLAIIQSSLDVLENQKRPAEQRREAARYLREEVRRLDGRLRAFLAFARPPAPRFKPMVLSSMISRRIASIEGLFPAINFQVEVHRPEPILMGDEEQLNQVLTNLVLNAGDALGGEPGAIRVRARQSGDCAIIEVEDDGPGIPEEHRGRIFDPFFTTKSDGTGLGLSICYQIVLTHGGTISIARGRDGRGSCFAIRIPIKTAGSPPSRP